MTARIYETPLPSLIKRIRAKHHQANEDFAKINFANPDPQLVHNLTHSVTDWQLAVHSYHERLKKSKR
jgi:hypothetical protein